jgi:glutamyl-tRNA synthetase
VRAATLAPHGPGGAAYPGTCRALDPAEVARRLAGGARASLRYRSADGSDDHVLRRSDGVVGYQLAVVVDDGEQGVTHVLRGEDLAPSTPRQIELWHSLDLGTPPRYLHVPLVVGPDGKRLGKRDGALSTREILASGTTPEQLVGWLAWSAGLVQTPAPVRARDLVGAFDERALPSEATSSEGNPWASGT